MGLKVSDPGGGGDRKPVPQGVHHAICIAIYDIGSQLNTISGNYNEQLIVTWEVPGQRMKWEKDGEQFEAPMVQSRFYTASLHEKSNLRKDLEGWREKQFTPEELAGFHLSKLLGVNCMLQIIHKVKGDRTTAQVKAVLKKLPNLPDLKPERHMILYSLVEPDMAEIHKNVRAFIHWGRDIMKPEINELIPDFVKSKILGCKEWTMMYGNPNESVDQGLPEDMPPVDEYDDDIPF